MLAEELALVGPLVEAIDAFDAPRRRGPLDGDLRLALSEALPLLRDLAASTRALLTRQLLRSLGFDECRLGGWRLEHKLVQALVFNHYAPGSLPATCGLDRLAQGTDATRLREVLRLQFPRGFVVKTALGDCSGDDCDYRTEAALLWMERGGRRMPESKLLTDEEFIAQQRVAIRHEYRVHTVEDRVIEDLTVRRHHGAVGSGERKGPNQFVQSILDALPAGITAGSILAWDAALLSDCTFSIIEVNVGGIHLIYNPGFHSSGYYHHKTYGAIYTARLLKFAERAYHCRIEIVADSPVHHDEHRFYQEVEDWKAQF